MTGFIKEISERVFVCTNTVKTSLFSGLHVPLDCDSRSLFQFQVRMHMFKYLKEEGSFLH